MRLFLACFATLLLMTSHALIAQDQDTLEVNQAANVVEETLDDVEEYLERNAEFGVKAGFNLSSLNSTESFGADSRIGLHLGAFGRYLWSERLSGKVEVLYSSLGARSDNFFVFEDYSLKLYYLDLIVSGEIMLTDGFRLELGPYLGVLLLSEQAFQDMDLARIQEGRAQAESDDTNFVDVGIMAGGTYSFDSGFGVGLRYQQGFTEALGNDFFRGASGSNVVFQLSALYTF